MVKAMGLCILVTIFQFFSRRDLWSQTATFKYVPSFKLGHLTGMYQNRFDIIWSCLRCSNKPNQREEWMTHAKYRWLLVDDFIDSFNTHRSDNVSTGSKICVDESMVRWYSHGGDWINRGLHHYIAINRNPDNGLEFQNSACGECGIMMRIKLVKGGSDHDNVENGVTHGAAVLMELVLPRVSTHRIVCADSYFALATETKLLHLNGLKFIGVVKTATRKYPMTHLASQEPEKRGDRYGLVKRNTSPYGCDLFAYVWMD